MDNSPARKVASMGHGTSDKRSKFVKLAERRTVNAIKSIRVIGKLGNPFAYEYTDADVRRIVAALNKEVEELKAKFASRSGKVAVEFKL